MTEITPENPATDAPLPRSITLTDSAVNRVTELLAAEEPIGDGKMMLRVYVNGGGCSGFTYGFSFDDEVGDDDRLFEIDGITVVSDDASLDLIGGSQLDWVESLGGASFQLTNPNATAQCGCGASFSV
ncbi:MAG: iron-sulfur cluster insertion protein ErpA [Alphaproteobacteria bacterium]|nr:iron-sulfur cluster insertion protein ErpA [Alphaproteobacteria bacterium]